MNAAANSNIKIMGITDEVLTCDCCGKTNLKRTVVLDIEGAIVHYGTSCAAKLLNKQGVKVSKQSVDLVAEVFAIYNKFAGKATLERIGMGIWNKLGLTYEVKNNQLIVKSPVTGLPMVVGQ